MLTASARERQDAKVQRVTVELTVEEERRQFEADVLERASEAISEVGDRIIPPPLLLFAHTQYTRRGVWMGVAPLRLNRQHKRAAEEAIATANSLRDQLALQEVERVRGEEEDRQAFRNTVMKHAQHMVRATMTIPLVLLFLLLCDNNVLLRFM